MKGFGVFSRLYLLVIFGICFFAISSSYLQAEHDNMIKKLNSDAGFDVFERYEIDFKANNNCTRVAVGHKYNTDYEWGTLECLNEYNKYHSIIESGICFTYLECKKLK